MSQLRLNPLAGRWVTVSGERAGRPQAFDPRMLPVEGDPARPCPFCPGHEESTPPALETYGSSGQWLVRVVPNHSCVVSNLVDRIWLVDGDEVLEQLPVAARGRIT